MAELGGFPMVVDGRLAQIGERESVADVARVLGRQCAAIVWRTFGQERIEEMAAYAGVPVVNALTDQFHPCQILADLMTIREQRGRLAGLTLAYVGDGANNMAHSYLLGGALAGLHVRIGAPAGFQPDPDDRGPGRDASPRRPAAACGSPTSAAEAVAGADVVATDTWVSMGSEDDGRDRTTPFRPVRGDRRPAGRRPGRDRAALPAGLPRRGDHRRGARRAAVGGLGRGREPAARAEGPAGLPRRAGRAP